MDVRKSVKYLISIVAIIYAISFFSRLFNEVDFGEDLVVVNITILSIDPLAAKILLVACIMFVIVGLSMLPAWKTKRKIRKLTCNATNGTWKWYGCKHPDKKVKRI